MEPVNCSTVLMEDNWSDSAIGSCSDMASPQNAGLNDDDDVLFFTSSCFDWPLTSLGDVPVLDSDWLQSLMVSDSDQTDRETPADTESRSTVSDVTRKYDVTVKQRLRLLARQRLIDRGQRPDDVTQLTSLQQRTTKVRHYIYTVCRKKVSQNILSYLLYKT